MSDTIFTALYATWSTSALLDVIDNPGEYQPVAVETARYELERRQLTEEQLLEAKEEQVSRRMTVEEEKARTALKQEKAVSIGRSIGSFVSLIDIAEPSTRRYIQIVTLLVGGYGLYLVYYKWYLLIELFSGELNHWGWLLLEVVIPPILVPTAAVLFWFRKKTGWILIVFFASYIALQAIPSYVREIGREPIVFGGYEFYAPIGPGPYIVSLLFFGTLTWTLCTMRMRRHYKVRAKTMQITLGVSTGLVLAFVLANL